MTLAKTDQKFALGATKTFAYSAAEWTLNSHDSRLCLHPSHHPPPCQVEPKLREQLQLIVFSTHLRPCAQSAPGAQLVFLPSMGPVPPPFYCSCAMACCLRSYHMAKHSLGCLTELLVIFSWLIKQIHKDLLHIEMETPAVSTTNMPGPWGHSVA